MLSVPPGSPRAWPRLGLRTKSRTTAEPTSAAQTLLAWTHLHASLKPNLRRSDCPQGLALPEPAFGGRSTPRPGARFAISSPPIQAAINPEAMQPNRAYWRACWSMPDARGERLTTSHAVNKGPAAPVTEAGTDLGRGWAGMPPAPEMSCAPRQLRLVPHPDIRMTYFRIGSYIKPE
jgi:hypothetical protein